MTERINLARLELRMAPLRPSTVLALIDAVRAAKRVADERSGHELGGEHPLYVKLCSLDEALDRFDFAAAGVLPAPDQQSARQKTPGAGGEQA